jgi:hypothetical protein
VTRDVIAEGGLTEPTSQCDAQVAKYVVEAIATADLKQQALRAVHVSRYDQPVFGRPVSVLTNSV